MLINDASITGSLIVNASSSFQNIAVSGNILPGTNNVYNLGSVDKFFKEIFVSTGSINFVDGDGIVTASLSANVLNSLIQNTGSANSSISSINTFTGSFSASVSSSIATISSSVTTTITTLSSSVSTSFSSSVASVTSLSSSVSASVTSLSSSLTSVNTTQNNRLGSIESITGSYATTGSNTFFGTQTFSGSVYIANDLIVQGSSSIQYISASSVSIGTNIVQLNTANPSVRFAGLTIIDSGSVGGSGSFLYDSVHDEFIFVHRGNGTNVTSSHFVLGPETYDSLGNETYLTNNRLPKGTGKEHLVDSQISDDGTTVSIGGALTVTGNITGPIRATNGVISGSSQVDLTATTNYASGILTRLNAETVVSGSKTISGITLGSNLATLTIGTGLSGTSYNGSTAVTIANTITNNNQLTNGAGYITSTGTAAAINQTIAAGSEGNLVFATIGTNDFFRIRGGGASNAGFIEIATADDGTEPIYVRQYTGEFTSLTRTATLLDGSGNTSFPGTITSAGNTIITSANIGSQTVSSATSVTGTSTISGKLTISNGANNALQINTDVADSNTRDAIYLYENSGQASGRQAISWYNGGNSYYKARLWTEVGSGYTATQFGIDVADDARSLSTRMYIRNGSANFSGDVTAYASDIRLKENIRPITNAIDRIKKINGVFYDWKDNVSELGFTPISKSDVGVLAQEVQAVFPEIVKPAPFDQENGVSKSGENYLTVKYEKLTALLIEAVKEQQIKIDNLTIEVENLKKPKGL